MAKPRRRARSRKVDFVEVVADERASAARRMEIVVERQPVRISCGSDAALGQMLDALKGFE